AAARRPAGLIMPAAPSPRRGAGARSVASSTTTPAHSPTGRSLSAGCSGWPTHRPPFNSSRRRLSWCRSRNGPSTPVSQSLRVRSQPSRSSQVARAPCQATHRGVVNGEPVAGSAGWPAAGGSSAWPLPVRIRFLHGGTSLWPILKRILQVFAHAARLTLLHQNTLARRRRVLGEADDPPPCTRPDVLLAL